MTSPLSRVFMRPWSTENRCLRGRPMPIVSTANFTRNSLKSCTGSRVRVSAQIFRSLQTSITSWYLMRSKPGWSRIVKWPCVETWRKNRSLLLWSESNGKIYLTRSTTPRMTTSKVIWPMAISPYLTKNSLVRSWLKMATFPKKVDISGRVPRWHNGRRVVAFTFTKTFSCRWIWRITCA